jgi:16S rRNA (cytosine967-C5)-methyltransferase
LSSSLTVSAARQVAYDILQLVAEGGYASDLLLERTRGINSRDAGLAAQLVFGCLRYQGQLDYLIRHYSGRRVEDVETVARVLLRLGIFQIRYLDRIPAHAAVHETVEQAKQYRRAASGFVNAVLRKVKRTPVRWPDRAAALSCPEWLLEGWTSHFGRGLAERIAEAALLEPERYLRVPPGGAAPAGLELAPTDIPGGFRIAGDARGVRLQDIGSQAIVPLLDLRPGLSFLDLCCAPGNKTVQALEVPLRGIACDVSWKRLREVPAVCPRVVLDATAPLPFRQKFDRILIDAPCSGTGTLSRNPEIKWRVTPQEFLRMQDRQVRILRRGLDQLAPGGLLVYATCSLEKEENEDVVRLAAGSKPAWKVRSEQWRLPGRDPGDGFYAAVITSGK